MPRMMFSTFTITVCTEVLENLSDVENTELAIQMANQAIKDEIVLDENNLIGIQVLEVGKDIKKPPQFELIKGGKQ